MFSYFDLLDIEQPESQSQMLHYLVEDEIISRQNNGLFSISNLGALLFGKKLSAFNRVWRKALRIIEYKDIGRTEGVREEVMDRGYTNRFIDAPPKTRNEKIAALFRRADTSEERGSGWDKIEMSCGDYYLPAPQITEYPYATRVTMTAHKAYRDMSVEERLWTCYIHTCYLQTIGKHLSNTFLRERFNLPESSKAMTSRLIKKAVDRGLIKRFDKDAGSKNISYVPYWA